jgi:predicted RNA-binding Zn ribbon-like protein
MSFVFVSGRPSLDFVGTLKWRRDQPEEQLTAPAALAAWVGAAELTDTPIRVDAAELAAAIEVREAIYRVIEARTRDGRPRRRDVAVLNQAAAQPPLSLTLDSTGRVRRTGSVAALRSALSRDALDLLGGEHAAQVRECARPDCTRLYVDVSRARNRRWCGMSECGNQAKVQAFRRRQP